MNFNYFRTIGSLMIISLLACGGTLKYHSEKLNTSQLVKHDGESTVALVYYDKENDENVSDIKVFCTGIWVDDTHILTANHCAKAIREKLRKEEDAKDKAPDCSIDDALAGNCLDVPVHKVISENGISIHYIERNEVVDPGKEPTAWHLSEVVKYDEAHDLVLLKAVGRAVPVHETAILAAAVPEIGESVHIVGHTKGLYWTFLEGSVSAYRGSLPLPDDMKNRAGPFLQLEVPAYYGNSGGGAFNNAGELVGMADFLSAGIPDCVFFVPVESIRTFLK